MGIKEADARMCTIPALDQSPIEVNFAPAHRWCGIWRRAGKALQGCSGAGDDGQVGRVGLGGGWD